MTNDSLFPVILSGLVLFVWLLMFLYHVSQRQSIKTKREKELREWYDEEKKVEE